MEKTSRIVRSNDRTELHVVSGADNVKYVLGAVGPGSYECVGQSILKSGLGVARGDLVAPLVHEVYCGPHLEQLASARQLLSDQRLWVFNCNIFTNDGVFSVADPMALGVGGVFRC